MKLERCHRLALCLIFCLAWYAWQARNAPAPAPDRPLLVNARARQPSVPQHTGADVRERETLKRMAVEKERRDLAASKSLTARAKLVTACQESWSQMLAANQAAFQALGEKAARSPNGETPCTLCDGKGYMHFCLVCRNQNRGLCQTCSGGGNDGFGDPCPACLGTRKCFNCFGSGKMLCPFCDDGTISAKGPAPPPTMPVR